MRSFFFLLIPFLVPPSFLSAQKVHRSLESTEENPERVYRLKMVQERPDPDEWERFSKLKNLSTLYLEDNLLDTVPASMGSLQRMTKFRSHRNPIQHFPDTTKNWRNLTYLELVGGKLDTFPEHCRYWGKLRELGINKNRAEQMVLPESIGRLKKLRLLAINESPLAPLPSSLTELSGLQKLILKDAGLERFPKGLGELQNLKTLVLEGNQLEEMPRSIGSLEELEYLSLKGNLLESLPQSISRCSSLKRLDIRDNYFSSYQLDILHSLLPDTEILHDPIEEKGD